MLMSSNSGCHRPGLLHHFISRPIIELRIKTRNCRSPNPIWIIMNFIKPVLGRLPRLRFKLPLFTVPKVRLRTVAVTSVCSLMAYHYVDLYVNRHLEVIYEHSDASIKELCGELRKCEFFPTFYLPIALLQIIWANRLDVQTIPMFRREMLPLKDGGQIALDWMIRKGSRNVVVLCHGLTGGTDCNYVKDSMLRLHKAGFTVVCVNQRGVAYSKLKTPKFCKLFDPTDLAEAIAHIKQQHPNAQLMGIGISKGANLILRYAALHKCEFKAIVSIANPYNLYTCAENLKRFTNKVYRDAITDNFKWLLRFHIEELTPNIKTHGIDIERALRAEGPEEYDECITRRLHGYDSVEQMYKDIGCDTLIQDIKVPVLLLGSKKDPISPMPAIPIERIRRNKNLILAFTRAGSHVEWYTGLFPQRWIMTPALVYLQHMADQHELPTQIQQ